MTANLQKKNSQTCAVLALYNSDKARDLTLAEILNAPQRMNESEKQELQTLEDAERQGLLTEQGVAHLAELRQQRALEPKRKDLKPLAVIRNASHTAAVKLLTVMLAEVQLAMGVTNTMNEQMLRLCAEDIATDDRYCWLTLADLKIVFQMARRGDFGKLYERINEATVYSWLEQYVDIRTKEADRQSFDTHNSRNRYEITPEQLDRLYQSLKMQPIKTQLPPTDEELRAKAEQDRREVAMLYGDTDRQETQETPEFWHETPEGIEMLAELTKAQN